MRPSLRSLPTLTANGHRELGGFTLFAALDVTYSLNGALDTDMH